MENTIRTAVAAAASRETRRQIVRALSAADVELKFMSEDGVSALRALANFRPNLLVTEVMLPNMDGISLTKRALCGFSLPVRPGVILLYESDYPPPEGELFARSGACLLSQPVSDETFSSEIKQLCAVAPTFSPEEKARTLRLLKDLGVPAHRGRDYLLTAILLYAADDRLLYNLSSRLYPIISAQYGTSVAQTERAICHVIELAWQSDKYDYQYHIFGDTIDAGRGLPTCGEMISRLADILRSEG